MNCEEINKLLSAYCDDALSEEEHALVQEHLKSCQACEAELSLLHKIKDAVGELPKMDAPQGFAQSLMQRIDSDPVKPVFPLRRIMTIAASLAIIGITIYLIYMSQEVFVGSEKTAPTQRPVAEFKQSKNGPVNDLGYATEKKAEFRKSLEEEELQEEDSEGIKALKGSRKNTGWKGLAGKDKDAAGALEMEAPLNKKENITRAVQEDALEPRAAVGGKKPESLKDALLVMGEPSWTLPKKLETQANKRGTAHLNGAGTAFEYLVIETDDQNYQKIVKTLMESDPELLLAGVKTHTPEKGVSSQLKKLDKEFAFGLTQIQVLKEKTRVSNRSRSKEQNYAKESRRDFFDEETKNEKTFYRLKLEETWIRDRIKPASRLEDKKQRAAPKAIQSGRTRTLFIIFPKKKK